MENGITQTRQMIHDSFGYGKDSQYRFMRLIGEKCSRHREINRKEWQQRLHDQARQHGQKKG